MGTLAKIFLKSLDWRTKALHGNHLAKILVPSLDWQTKATWELWQRFSCHPWTDEKKLYVGILAKIFLPSLDWRTKALRGNFGKDFPAILGLTNKSSMWELWQRFSCQQKLLRLSNKSSMWKHWQRFFCHASTDEWQRLSCHPWTVEQKLYVRTLAKIFLPSLDWWMAKSLMPSSDWRTKSFMWKHWQRFSCHP